MTTALLPVELHALDTFDSGFLSITEWRAGERPTELPSIDDAAERLAAGGAVVCVDVCYGADPVTVHESLARLFGDQIKLEMVEDLLEPDTLPSVSPWAGGQVRSVSAFGVDAINPPAGDRATAGWLAFRLVEMLVGPGWIVTCCQATDTRPHGKPLPRELANWASSCGDLIDAAAGRWLDGPHETAADLGLVLLHELTRTFRQARHCLYDWLENWEVEFFADTRTERHTLVELRTMIAEFRKRLAALNVAADDAHTAWFGAVSEPALARRADSQIDRALGDLRELGQMLRTTFDLVEMQQAQEHQEMQEGLGRKVELVTAVFLVPTLVAGFFGANTWLPSERRFSADPTHHAFWSMVVAMLVGAVLVYGVLSMLRRRAESRVRTRRTSIDIRTGEIQ